MDNTDFGRMIYLVVLGAAVIFWFVSNHRQSFGKTLQQALAWGLIFLGVIAAAGMWSDIRTTIRPKQAVFDPQGRVEIPRSPDGHYRLTATVNNTPVLFIVDTGATDVVLTQNDAARVGLDVDSLPFLGRALTANGEVRTASVTLDHIEVGSLKDESIHASVNGGEMQESLLGMSYLQFYQEITISRGTMYLKR